MIFYKLTRKSQMFVVNELAQRAIVFFGGLVVLRILFPAIFTDDTIFGLSMLSFWIIWYCFWELLPLPFVHFQYLKYNKHTELSIDKNKRIMIVKEEDNVYSFRFDQIKIIHLAMMGTIINGRKHGFITVNRYHYALIETQDGHRFFITCLLINNLMNFFDENGLYYEKEQIYCPRIRLGRYKQSQIGVDS
jgi:hypothetical protein